MITNDKRWFMLFIPTSVADNHSYITAFFFSIYLYLFKKKSIVKTLSLNHELVIMVLLHKGVCMLLLFKTRFFCCFTVTFFIIFLWISMGWYSHPQLLVTPPPPQRVIYRYTHMPARGGYFCHSCSHWSNQWPFQVPKLEILCHIRQDFDLFGAYKLT